MDPRPTIGCSEPTQDIQTGCSNRLVTIRHPKPPGIDIMLIWTVRHLCCLMQITEEIGIACGYEFWAGEG